MGDIAYLQYFCQRKNSMSKFFGQHLRFSAGGQIGLSGGILSMLLHLTGQGFSKHYLRWVVFELFPPNRVRILRFCIFIKI